MSISEILAGLEGLASSTSPVAKQQPSLRDDSLAGHRRPGLQHLPLRQHRHPDPFLPFLFSQARSAGGPVDSSGRCLCLLTPVGVACITVGWLQNPLSARSRLCDVRYLEETSRPFQQSLPFPPLPSLSWGMKTLFTPSTPALTAQSA
jgi:hypothetical protein